MDVPRYLYAFVVGVVLVAILATWIFVRVRNRVGSLRIEPGMGTGVPAGAGATNGRERPAAPTHTSADLPPGPVPDILTSAPAAIPSEPVNKAPDGAIEQGYKGFRIRLREKQPGLWVAFIADGTQRSRRRSGEDRKMPATGEHYQMPTALAEAKGLIDRRLATRH